VRYGDPPKPPTEAQQNAARDKADAHPPMHEQHPLSETEARLVDEAAAKLRNTPKRGRRG
jgi:hypothetical protein